MSTEKWIVTEYPEEFDFAVACGEEILATIVGGNTIGEQCDLAQRMASVPELERQLTAALAFAEDNRLCAESNLAECRRLEALLLKATEAAEQRDRLAEAIRRMLPHIPDMEPTGAAKYAESNLAAWGLRQTLATLDRKEGQP